MYQPSPIAPLQKTVVEPIDLTNIEKKAPTKAAGPKFFVKKITVDGIKNFKNEEDLIWPILEKYENREVDFAELTQLARDIETAYLKQGLIAACIIPQQESTNGEFILKVIEAKMGKLIINDHRYFKKNITERYWIPKTGETLRYSEMLKSLYLANKNPDKKVKSTLAASETPEQTDVILDVKTAFPIHLLTNFDQEGAPETGEKRWTGILRHNNFLGIDDTFISAYQMGSDFNSLYFYHRLPINKWGTSFVYSTNTSRSSPQNEFADLDVMSHSKNNFFGFEQDIFNEGKLTHTLRLGLDSKDKSTQTVAGTLNRDRLRVLRLSDSLTYHGLGGITMIEPSLSQGINGFGALRKNPYSSRNAENTFTIFNVNIQHQMNLPFQSEGRLRFANQLSSEKLTPQEEFYLGGMNSVRGYPSGDFAADDAIQFNAEWYIPPPLIPNTYMVPFTNITFLNNIRLVGFFDYGWGNKRDTSSTEKDTATLMSTGAGINLNFLTYSRLRLEWGFPIGDDSITDKEKSQFHFAVNFEY